MGFQSDKGDQSVEDIRVLPERHLPDDRLRILHNQALRYIAHHLRNTRHNDDVAHVDGVVARLEINGKDDRSERESDLPYTLHVRFALAVTTQ